MRTWIGVALVLVVIQPAKAAGLASISAAPAAAPLEETRHGIATSDPYRWMEDPAREKELLAFIKAASRETRAQLLGLPRRADFVAQLELATKAGVRFTNAKAAGRRVFYERLAPTDRVAKLVVREGGAERVLFDPAAENANAAIGEWRVSPDGGTVALHVSDAGSEVGAIRFLDVATAKATRSSLAPAWSEFGVTWLTPDRIGYNLLDPKSVDPLQNSRTYVEPALGKGQPVAVLGSGLSLSPPMAPAEFPVVANTGRSEWAIGYAAGARADRRVLVARRTELAAGNPSWREIATYNDQVRVAAAHGRYLWLVTTKDAPNGKVERFDPATDARETIATPPGLVLNDLRMADDGLYVLARADGAARLIFLPHSGGAAQDVKLPFEADFADAAAMADGRGITFSLVGWTTAPRGYSAIGGRLESLRLDSQSWKAAAGFSVRREEAVSADGTRVPMVVVTPKGGGPWPTILQAYGAYGAPTATPRYNPFLLAWSGQGGATAYCGTRGGSERGRAWHEGGRERHKPNAHADYIACAERLISAGVARPGGIAATGTSAGGLLAPVAVQKRPELFGALLPRVAILNPSRLEVAPNGPNQFGEMGDPRTAKGYAALVAQDAYLGLADARDLPDTLVTIGLNDRRVTPWMGAKFAAHARDRFGTSRVVMVRADEEAGHGRGSARDVLINEWADVFSFLADRLAVHAEQVAHR